MYYTTCLHIIYQLPGGTYVVDPSNTLQYHNNNLINYIIPNRYYTVQYGTTRYQATGVTAIHRTYQSHDSLGSAGPRYYYHTSYLLDVPVWY